MSEISRKCIKVAFFCSLLFFFGSLCRAGQVLDPNRYIGIDEIRPGMKAYCLTVFKGSKVEKFGLDVLDVVRNVWPGRDAILVQGTDERFIHTGPVGGCSGSPVYIDGRLAGALAFGFLYSKDPLYGVTPIKDMLRVGAAGAKSEPGFVLDFAGPIDFGKICQQLSDYRYWKPDSGSDISGSASGFNPLPCPLVTCGLPAEVVEQLDGTVRPLGLMAVAGIGGGSSFAAGALSPNSPAGGRDQSKPKLVPGACLALPLVTGDITIDVIGTVTEVVGDKVYGFGHSFLGYGQIDLPMATGQVHTVISSIVRSSKFATAAEIVGALRMDESTAVRGRIGAKARMIPLSLKVNRYNDPEERIYNCRIVDNRLLTPVMLRYSVMGAALFLGRLPPRHMIKYKVDIKAARNRSISFENVSTSVGLAEMITESIGSVALLMNNPYRSIDLESISVEISIEPKNIISHIWSAELSDTTVKPGDKIGIDVTVESFLAEKKKYRCSLKVPDELAPGRYQLLLCGGYNYLQFLRQAAPYRFIPENLPGLIEAMEYILHIKRDELHCILLLPAGGVALEKAELPDLPATKALVLQDEKRTLRVQPYQQWLRKSFHTGTIIRDKQIMYITVEK